MTDDEKTALLRFFSDKWVGMEPEKLDKFAEWLEEFENPNIQFARTCEDAQRGPQLNEKRIAYLALAGADQRVRDARMVLTTEKHIAARKEFNEVLEWALKIDPEIKLRSGKRPEPLEE